jgi:hypothetical protein
MAFPVLSASIADVDRSSTSYEQAKGEAERAHSCQRHQRLTPDHAAYI